MSLCRVSSGMSAMPHGIESLESGAQSCRARRVRPSSSAASRSSSTRYCCGTPRAIGIRAARWCASRASAASASRRMPRRSTTSSRVEVVRLGERDAELGRPVDARQLAAHPVEHDVAPAVGQRVRRPLGTVAVAIDAHLGEQSRPLEPADGVVERAVLDRHEPVVAPVAHQSHHLVRVHVALAQQREHHHTERRELRAEVRP